jgi:hypothetical protein
MTEYIPESLVRNKIMCEKSGCSSNFPLDICFCHPISVLSSFRSLNVIYGVSLHINGAEDAFGKDRFLFRCRFRRLFTVMQCSLHESVTVCLSWLTGHCEKRKASFEAKIVLLPGAVLSLTCLLVSFILRITSS